MRDLGEIVGVLESELGPVDRAPVPLQGGITNRNFLVSFGGRQCVVRLPGKDTGLLGIDRTAERLAGERAAALGIAPAVLSAGEDYLVTEFLDGEPAGPDRLRDEPEPVARALRAFHDSGLQLPTRFWVPDLLDDYARIVVDRGGSLPAPYQQVSELARAIATVLPLMQPVPCHDDLLPANVLIAADRTVLVDWEYAGMGHRLFDLGNVSVNNEFDGQADERLLQAYFGEPPTPARRAALALMRIMSDAREAAWGVLQRAVSELEFDFEQYADEHFERFEQAARDPRLNEWLGAAAA